MNDHNVLCAVAESVGLSGEDARAYLNSTEDESEIRLMDKQFKQGHRGVNGVPHFMIKTEDMSDSYVSWKAWTSINMQEERIGSAGPECVCSNVQKDPR